jgi:hypothetical protein
MSKAEDLMCSSEHRAEIVGAEPDREHAPLTRQLGHCASRRASVKLQWASRAWFKSLYW